MFFSNSDEKPQTMSWWKRHCTPPPAANRTVMCPCTACFAAGNVIAAPEPRPRLTPSSTSDSSSSLSSLASNDSGHRNVLRKNSADKKNDCEVDPLMRGSRRSSLSQTSTVVFSHVEGQERQVTEKEAL